MKHKIFLLFCFFGFLQGVFAQQAPQYTQYQLNGFLLNPAVAGIENYVDLRMGSRLQWRGLSGAPTTQYVTVHAPLGRQFLFDNVSSMSGQGNNPMSRSYVQTYQAAPAHHGVGLTAQVDETGPISQTDLTASYAYHLGVSSQLNISAGISAGISQINLDAADITLEDYSDALLANLSNHQLEPKLSAGIWVYGSRFYGGIALQNLLTNRLSFAADNTNTVQKQQAQVFLSAGYKVSLSEEMAFFPSLLVNYTAASTSVDANVKLAFRDKFWLGGGWRKNDSFSANAGFNIGYLFNLGYAYDFTTSKLNTVSYGTHEFVLGILLNNRYKVSCPQMNW
ncbi:MAG: type IX secretion system membrane protein PorP/SprF [Sphingobacteriaceae bacterium]